MHGKKVMVVVLCALMLFGALAFASVSLGQQKALADEATFYSTASDGYLEAYNSTYSVAHDASTGIVNDGFTFLAIGQLLNPSVLQVIERGAVFFDTSSLPDTAVITAANLSLYGDDFWNVTQFEIVVVDGSLLNDPLVPGDYGDLLNQTTSGGALTTIGIDNADYNDILLNSVGMGWISNTGMTQFGLRSSRDITATVPTGYEYVTVHSSREGEEGERRPKLVVSYFTAPPTFERTPTPTVTPTIPPTPTDVPTLSQWGMIGMGILLAAALVWSIRRRWLVSTDKS